MEESECLGREIGLESEKPMDNADRRLGFCGVGLMISRERAKGAKAETETAIRGAVWVTFLLAALVPLRELRGFA